MVKGNSFYCRLEGEHSQRLTGRLQSRRERNRHILASRLDVVVRRMWGRSQGKQSVGKRDQERQARERGPSGKDKRESTVATR